MEEEISLVELFQIIKKKTGMIISLALVGLILSATYTFFIAKPQFSSTTQLLVNRKQTTEVIQQSDINTNLQLINTYKDIIKGPVILDDVRNQLSLEVDQQELSSKIQVNNENNSQVFSLKITDGNPYDAAVLANTIADTFKTKIHEIMNVDNVSVISEAIPNTSPVSPNKTLNLAIGLLLGLMLGVGGAFVLEFLDNTVKDEQFITTELEWTNLGKISELSANELKEELPMSAPNKRKAPMRSARTRV